MPLQWREGLIDVYTIVWQTIPSVYTDDIAEMEPLNVAFATRARSTSSAEYIQAFAEVQKYGRTVAAFCAGYDAVLTPTLALPPVRIGWVREPEDPWEQHQRAIDFAPFTAPANVAGLPAVSVPFGWSEAGLPVGIQLVASAGDEATLLRLSAQIEEARPWSERRPGD